MCTAAVPADSGEDLRLLEALLGRLGGADAAGLPAEVLAERLRVLERAEDEAEEIVVGAARAGADLRALAAICAEIRYRTAPPDPDDERDKHLDRGVSFDTTFDGAGVIHGDLTPECAAMVEAVLDALSAPAGGGDLRTRPRYHDALEEAMKRLLAADLLPKRAGQPAKALVHIYFAELCAMDAGSALQDTWVAEYRARWAAHRAAASVSTGDRGQPGSTPRTSGPARRVFRHDRRHGIGPHLRADLPWCGHGLHSGRRIVRRPPMVVVSRLSGPLLTPARGEERE